VTNDESNSLPKRAARYAHVTQAAVRVGAKAAASRLKSSQKKESSIDPALLRSVLGSLKGPLMKIAQLLATVPDFLPADMATELMSLQANAPPMGWPFVRRRMAAELGADWQSCFKSFEPQAACAASLGQVHRATSHEGEALACKLQYADMASVVEADLTQLKILFGLLDRFDGAIQSAGAPYQEIAERLREELDYTREAKALALYGEMLAQTEGVHVPRPHLSLSTGRLLTMDWLDGEKMIDATSSRSQEERNRIAMNMFRLWYTPFYHYGVIHGDPHMGNYTVREDGSINLLDFGCIRIFKPQLIEAVILLFHALREEDKEKTHEAFRLWGFTTLTNELTDLLTQWAQFVYAPVLHDSTRPLHETNDTAKGRETAFKIHKELRRLGGIAIPPEFILIDRASIGLGSVFLRLGAEVNWFRLFNELVQDFDVEKLVARQKKILGNHGLAGG